MVVALTLLALAVVDGISGDIVKAMPSTFFTTLSGAWGTSGFGGLASSALAFLAAFLEMAISLLLFGRRLYAMRGPWFRGDLHLANDRGKCLLEMPAPGTGRHQRRN